MAFVEKAFMLFFVVMVAFSVSSMATDYQVGDDQGWTTSGNVDYAKWASSKVFGVGDKFVFKYDPKLHNVLEVTYENYKKCNGTAPIATYTSGNDAVSFKSKGHYYFICGIPGHCDAHKQKVDFRVVNDAPSHSTPAPPHNNEPAAPAHNHSHVSAPAPAPEGSGSSDLLPSFSIVVGFAGLAFVMLLGFA